MVKSSYIWVLSNVKNKVMTKRKVIEPLEMVRNIVGEIDGQIQSTQSTIKFIKSEKDSEQKEALLLEYDGFLKSLIRLREFVIYKA